MKNDGRRGTIDSKEFIDMFKEVATRPEVYFLLIRWEHKINLINITGLGTYNRSESTREPYLEYKF